MGHSKPLVNIDQHYQNKVNSALSEVLKRSRDRAVTFGLGTDKWVTFSDLHKGTQQLSI